MNEHGPLQLLEAMSDTAAALRNRALECERKAALAKDDAARGRFLDLAREWREMAADYEELCKPRADP